MAIPQQVQDAADAAEELIKNRSQSGNTPGNAGAVPTAPAVPAAGTPGEPVPNTPTEGTQTPTEPTPASNSNVSNIAQPAPTEGAQPAPTTPQGEPAEYKRLVHQHRTLQGMYNSVDAKFRESEARNNDLQNQIQELRNAFATTQQQQPMQQAGVTQPAPVLSAEEQQEYSPKFFDMMNRWLDQKLAPVFQRLESVSQVPQVVEQLNHQVRDVYVNQQDNATRQFYGYLNQAHPDWEEINDTVKFNDWLQGIDGMTGVTRQTLVDNAREGLDFNRVIAIFSAYKDYAGIGGQAVNNQVTNTQPLQTQQQYQQPTNPALEQAQVVPTHRTGTPATQENKPRLTKADLLKLYEDERKGLYRGKEAEFRQREQDLVAAINEGRYIN